MVYQNNKKNHIATAILCVLVAMMNMDMTLSHSVSKDNYNLPKHDRKMCTAIGTGASATIDGSTMTTHNSDCMECDFRITHVPARDWPAGSKRPVYPIRIAYPRIVQDGIIDNNMGPDYRESETYPDRSIYPWNASRPLIYIDQVPHTYAYTMGVYGIQNEKQVSIGESTCGAIYIANPINQGGFAAMDMQTLTQLVMERCDSARCAVKLMGDMSTSYGFYGSGGIEDEAGEAIVVSDPRETWMFHVLPDDTGSSAIWVAQRVPDDHITAVANQFVIGEVDLTDRKNFLSSSNMLTIAASNGLWNPNEPFHFAKVYGQPIYGQSMECTRRVWRVLTLAAPSLLPQFSPFTDSWNTFGFGTDGRQPYPFSVKPDNLLAVSDLMTMNRDQFEGTAFDMTTGVGAGPFGDPLRHYALSRDDDPVNGVSDDDVAAGLGYERQIALWRTSYSTITQSRRWLPDVIGAVTWIAQYNPRHSTFIPVYANAARAPQSMNTGTLFKADRVSNWWVHSVCSNYLSRVYKYAIGDIMSHQKALETRIYKSTSDAESRALEFLHRRSPSTVAAESQNSQHTDDEPRMMPVLPPGADPDGPHPLVKDVLNASTVDPTIAVVALLTDFSDRLAADVRDKWWDFFFHVVGVYRDTYKLVNPHAEIFTSAYEYTAVPRWWLEQIGYWGAPGTPAPSEKEPVGILPLSYPTVESKHAYNEEFKHGENTSYPWFPPQETIELMEENDMLYAKVRSLSVRVGIAAALGTGLGMLVMYCVMLPTHRRSHGYTAIQ